MLVKIAYDNFTHNNTKHLTVFKVPTFTAVKLLKTFHCTVSWHIAHSALDASLAHK